MLRSLLAYLTLGIFLLNVLGYYGIFQGAKKLSGDRLAARLSSDVYDLGGNVTIKVPLALPYEVTSDHFEQEDGEFEIDGEIYRIIKQRHYNDTLYMVCIRDENTTRLHSAFEDYVESFAGQDDGDAQQSAPGLIKDFVSEEIELKNSVVGWEECITLATDASLLTDSYFASFVHPPERILFYTA